MERKIVISYNANYLLYIIFIAMYRLTSKIKIYYFANLENLILIDWFYLWYNLKKFFYLLKNMIKKKEKESKFHYQHKIKG